MSADDGYSRLDRMDGLGRVEGELPSRYVAPPKRLSEPTPSMGWDDEADPKMWKRVLIILGCSIIIVGSIVGVGILWVQVNSW